MIQFAEVEIIDLVAEQGIAEVLHRISFCRGLTAEQRSALVGLVEDIKSVTQIDQETRAFTKVLDSNRDVTRFSRNSDALDLLREFRSNLEVVC